MSSPSGRSRFRRVQSPPLALLGVAAALIGAALLTVAVGLFGRTHFQLEIEARDLATGEVRWVLNEGSNDYPLFTDEFLLYTSGDETVAIDATGAVRWRVGGDRAWSAVTAGDVVLVEKGDHYPPSVLAIDAATGEVRWRATERWVGRAGDRYVVLRSDDMDEVVESSSGTVFHVAENLSDVIVQDGIIAYQAQRSLHALRPAEGSMVELSERRWRRLVAVVDPIVVAEYAEALESGTTGPRPRILAGYDSRTGEVRWETPSTQFGERVVQDGRRLRFVRGMQVTEVDALTGETSGPNPLASHDPVEWLETTSSRSVIVDRFERIDEGSGDVMLLTSGLDGVGNAGSTIAVDIETRLVMWTMVGTMPVTANADVTILHVEGSFHFLDTRTGSIMTTVPGKGRFAARAAATDRWATVVSGSELIVVDATGRARTVADGLGSKARIEGARGDLVVVGERRGSDQQTGERFLTAYDVAAGEELWSHAVPWNGEARLAGDTVQFATRNQVTEIALASGERTERSAAIADDIEESSRRVVAAFDSELSRLLWSADLERTERVAVVGDAVVMYRVEASSERFVPDD